MIKFKLCNNCCNYATFQAAGGPARRAGLHRGDADPKGRGDGGVLRRAVHLRDTREGAQRGRRRAHVAHHHTHQGGPREVQGATDYRAHRLRRRQY